MTLTIGSAPFGRRPGGSFNFTYSAPEHVLYFEESPRRVRVELEGRTVADSRRPRLMHETGHLPVYYFPTDDVDERALEPTDHVTHCPFKGYASHWSVRTGDRVAENAVWGYPDPIEGAPPLAGYLAFHWGAMDRWLEEDEEIHGHPRDPYTRIDVRESSRHVRVSLDGQVVAESRRPKLLFETSLVTRIYLPRPDVRTELLTRSGTATYCPYKGHASYWSFRDGDSDLDDVAWSYGEPFEEASKVRDHLSFLHERLLVEMDGEPLEHQAHRR
jgi:uncharacterized protein (DUF427 family)